MRPAVGLLRMAGDLGSVEPGEHADLAALAAEPLADTRAPREERMACNCGRLVQRPVDPW
jgi:imidazolonepropionase-like amidohydrolase